MRYLKENTATRITVGPFYDVTDGITPEIALTVTGCWLTFIVDDAGVPTLVLDVAPTASAGNNDMVHITSDAGGYYDLELTAANTNYTGRATLSIHDTDVHLPVFHEFQIVSANVYDSLFTDGDVLDTSVTQLGGVAQSLTDLKDFADAGYDPVTNKVQGVVLTDTVTTNTDLVSAASVRTEIDSNSTKLATLAGGIIEGTTSGTPSTTSTDTNLSGYVTGELVGRVIVFTGGTADGQAAEILTYTSTNGVVTFAALTTAPAASDPFKII
jgi:hypothetical protein